MEYAVVTETGLALQAKLTAGSTMFFTRFVAGSGAVSPVLLQNQTEVSQPKQEFLFGDSPYYSAEFDGEVIISMIMTSENTKEEYKCSQIGIYAEDPDVGEILYAILQTDTPFKVPAARENNAWSTEFAVTIKYSGADTVNLYVNASGMMMRHTAEKRYMKKLIYNGKLYGFKKDENGVYLAEIDEEFPGDSTEVVRISDADIEKLKETFVTLEDFSKLKLTSSNNNGYVTLKIGG